VKNGEAISMGKSDKQQNLSNFKWNSYPHAIKELPKKVL
jgi:hypothetical protein